MNAIIPYDITKYRVRRNHTVRSTHCCPLSSMLIFTVSYSQLTKSSDEMSTKNLRILVLVSVSSTKISDF